MQYEFKSSLYIYNITLDKILSSLSPLSLSLTNGDYTNSHMITLDKILSQKKKKDSLSSLSLTRSLMDTTLRQAPSTLLQAQ